MNASKRYLSRVAELGCILCDHQGREGTPAEIHHIREGVGASQRQTDWMVVPLCPACHRGNEGIHGLGKHGFYTRYKLDELDLLSMVIAKLNP